MKLEHPLPAVKPTFGVPQDAYQQLMKKYEDAQSLGASGE
jgi:hypothetical protein